MLLNDARFCEHVFGDNVNSFSSLRLQSQQNVVDYLRSILTCRRGVRLLYGPASSGKSTIVRRFVEELPNDVAVAVVDGSGLAPKEFLSRILARFGYNVEIQAADDLLRMVNVFAAQQTRVTQSPLVVVENVENMQAGALHALSMLATLMSQERFAVRIVVTGGSKALLPLQSKGMTPISNRIESVFEVAPFSPMESMLYLHGRMRACGVDRPDEVLPLHVCDRLHLLSSGLPGLLNKHTKGVLGQAKSLPVSEADVRRYQKLECEKPPVPRLIVTNNGKVVAVETTKGTVRCDAIALCTGLWSRKAAAMAGVEAPVWPCEHFYLLTKPVPKWYCHRCAPGAAIASSMVAGMRCHIASQTGRRSEYE